MAMWVPRAGGATRALHASPATLHTDNPWGLSADQTMGSSSVTAARGSGRSASPGDRGDPCPRRPAKRGLEILGVMMAREVTLPHPGHQILADARPHTVRSSRLLHLIPVTIP